MPRATIEPNTGHLGVTLGRHNNGVRVEVAHPHDLVAKARIFAGDIIIGFNGDAVYEHEALLKLMVDATAPYVLDFEPFPEMPKLKALRDRAVSAGWTAICCTAPALVVVGSSDTGTFISGLILFASLVLVAVVLYRPRVLHGGRNAICVLGFGCAFALVAAGQEVRRCAGTICDHPTMYGTEADCRAVCATAYAALHWPAVGASALATIASGRAALFFLWATEAADELPEGWWRERL